MAIFLLPMVIYFMLFFFFFPRLQVVVVIRDTYFYFYVFYVHHPFHNIKIIGIGQLRNHKIYSFFCLHNFFSLSLFHPPSSSSTNEFLFCLITDERERASVGGGDKGSKKVCFGFFYFSFSLNFSRRAAFFQSTSLTPNIFFTLKKR